MRVWLCLAEAVVGGVRGSTAVGSLPAEARLRLARRRPGYGEAKAGAVSSVVEHRLYTPAVTGSNPVPPTRMEVGSSKCEV